MVGTDRLRPRPSHYALRTCVGCRRRDDRSALLRVVVVEENGRYAALPDTRHRLAGRGSWLHPTPECLDRAARRKAFGRALRVRAPLDLSAVVAWLESSSPSSSVPPGAGGKL